MSEERFHAPKTPAQIEAAKAALAERFAQSRKFAEALRKAAKVRGDFLRRIVR